ncbi:hypothetical protein V5O48_000060 [Marasmius crinis-equi]|uniref:C3H1-type domain-containing protein n=1 Tax=Marasmius crinis-equi TaxID=585013 RepID=A0ABR3G2R8_9AGAR
MLTRNSVQHVWGELINNLISVADGTVKRNAELEARVEELELQLALWKQAHGAALEASETHKVQIATLNKQISGMDVFRAAVDPPLIHCVLNGDETFFANLLLVQGFQGGQRAAHLLTKAIAECLSREETHLFTGLTFWVTLFVNKAQLGNTLVGQNVCTKDQFDSFLAGFSQASSRFLVVDVCGSEGGADAKIKEYLATYAHLPQTLKMFIGGCYTRNYAAVLGALDGEGLLGKTVLLHSGFIEPVNELQRYKMPLLEIDGLFVDSPQGSLGPLTRLSPLQVAQYNGIPTNGGLASPQSPVRATKRFVDPSLPLHKQSPPPCNEHYLMTCSKGAGTCKYSHDYVLSPEQLSALASNAKKAPCNWLKNGLPCPYGEKCCWGHVCPNGPNCFHLSKGKCWFKSDGMHRPPGSPARPESSRGELC